MKSHFLKILLLTSPAFLLYCCKINNLKKIQGEWINPYICQSENPFILDFQKETETLLSGEKRSIEIRNMTAFIDGTPLTLQNNQADKLVLYGDDRNFTFYNKSRFCKRCAFDSPFLENKLWEIHPLKNDTRYLMEFHPKSIYILTSINSRDTASSVYKWSAHTVSSISVLITRDVVCNRFFVKEVDEDFFLADSFENDSLSEVRFNLVKQGPVIDRKELEGTWSVPEWLSGMEFSKLEITSKGISVNGRAPIQWHLDHFGKLLIMKIGDDEYKTYNLLKIDSNTLVLERNGVAYELSKQ